MLHPRAWAQSEWWTAGQVENVLTLVDTVKRRYNVDESRVYLTGISDGGTGAYFLAMRLATPWAACLPLNGHPSVLANPDVGADGQLYPANLANCPLRIVNGGRDRLYPAASVVPLIEMFKRGGIPLEFQVYEEAGHDTSWWPEERAKIRGVSRGPPAPAAPRTRVVGNRARGPLQPLPLGRHRPAGRAAVGRGAGGREPLLARGHPDVPLVRPVQAVRSRGRRPRPATGWT